MLPDCVTYNTLALEISTPRIATMDQTQMTCGVTNELPVEMILHIASFLVSDDDRHTNRLYFHNLSLVNKSFRSVFIPLLLEHVIIEKDGDNDWTLSALVRFCQAIASGDKAALRLAHCVRKCTIVDHASDYLPTKPLNRIYIQALRSMPNITSFKIKRYPVDDIMCETFSCFHQLRSLSITGATRIGGDFSASYEKTETVLVSLATSIQHFELFHTTFTSDATRSLLVKAITPLRLYKFAAQETRLIDSFLRQSGRSVVRDLTLDTVSGFDVLMQFLNSTPTITSLRICQIAVHSGGDSASASSPILRPDSLPLLSILRCPGGWIKHIVPRRPVQDVDISKCYFKIPLPSLGPFHMGDKAYTGMERDPTALVSLQESEETIRRLCLTPSDYCQHLLKQDLRKDFAIKELILEDDFFAFVVTLMLRADITIPRQYCLTLEGAEITFQELSGPLSTTVKCLRTQGSFLTQWWDLPFQHKIISTSASTAFPNASRIQLCEWIEWFREDGTWKPSLRLDEVDGRPPSRPPKTLLAFQKMLVREDFKHKLRDREGFFQRFRI